MPVARSRRKADKVEAVVEPVSKIDEVIATAEHKKPEDVAIENMPLNTLGDYIRYNTKARALNHKLKICRYQIKPCPIDLHPSDTVIVSCKEHKNPIPVYLSNDMIDFKMKLDQGKKYKLPRCVVEYLASKGTDVFGWVTNADGSQESKVTSFDPRFAVRTIYE